ncbi:MAG TPA: SusC/RagA family TonB-linked outer membrane protein [Puia sp.]|nr:SusC/RagA family TonB-linked outer membrane protein [Puia sp.]
MMKKTPLLCLFFLACSFLAFAQERTITGKISEETNKSSIAGATITVKGARKTVTADGAGAFTITVPQGRVILIITSIGFAAKEVAVGAEERTVDILLSTENKQLGEVIVTALGITRQEKTLVYATQTVKPAELTGVRDANNVLNSLQGKVANAVITQGSGGPGSGARIVLRGNRSIQQSNNALIVVDGVPINNSTYSMSGSDFGSIQGSDGASSINPDDIESVTVLRGASAAALYGSQAGNGVIVITTKKGAKEKASININSGITAESPFALPKVQNSYGQGANGLLDVSKGTSWGAKMTGQTYTDYLGKQAAYSAQPDNIRDLFRTGASLNNSISVSGGSEKSTTYLSYTNNNIHGIIPKNNMMRHTVTLRQTNQFGKRFSTDAKITYLVEDIKNRPRTGEENSPVVDIYQIPRNVPTSDAEQYQVFNSFNIPGAAPWPSTNSGIYQNPYWMLNNTAQNQNRNRVIGFISAKLQLTSWLNVTGRAKLDRTFDAIETKYQQGTILWATKAGGFYQKDNIVTTQKWFDLIFDGTNKITKDLKVNYHFGAIYQDNQFTSDQSKADGLNVTNKFSLNFATTPAFLSAGQDVQTHAVFGQANFSFKDAIFLDASLRNDWDSRLPSPYSYQYYSVGASALLSDLFVLPTAISFLKASASYAEVGNGGQFGLLFPTYSYGQGAGNGFLSRDVILPFPNVKPEIVRNLEFGAEAKFLNNMFGFSLTYYKSNSVNQLLRLDLPVGTGYATQYINAGKIRNQGLELVINATPVRTKDFTWDIAVNLALNRNKIISLSDLVKTAYLTGDAKPGFLRSIRPIAVEGGSYGDLQSNYWLKDTKGNFELNPDGTPLTTYQTGGLPKVIGNFNPRETVGMTNSFRYKAFTARVLVDGRIGGTLVSGTEMNLAFSGIPEATSKYREGGWILGGVDGTSGAPVSKAISAQDFWTKASAQRYGNADFFAYNATSIRMRELSLGYDLPIHFNVIKTARLSAIARNVFWIYRGKSIMDIPGLGKRKMWMDPDMSLGNGNFQGVEYFAMPSTRSYGLNLQLTF